MKTMISMKHFFFVADAFWLFFFCFASGALHWHLYFLLVGKVLSFWGNPIFRGHPPPWGWSRARRGGWWRRHGDVGRFGGDKRKIPAVDAVGAQVMCFSWVFYMKKQVKHGEDMVGWWVWNLLQFFCGGYVLREWDEPMCYWPSL